MVGKWEKTLRPTVHKINDVSTLLKRRMGMISDIVNFHKAPETTPGSSRSRLRLRALPCCGQKLEEGSVEISCSQGCSVRIIIPQERSAQISHTLGYLIAYSRQENWIGSTQEAPSLHKCTGYNASTILDLWHSRKNPHRPRSPSYQSHQECWRPLNKTIH